MTFSKWCLPRINLWCFLLRRLGHGHLLPALWEALPDPDSVAAAHGSPRRGSQLHLQRMQPDFPQPYCTQASPTLTHRSVKAVINHLGCGEKAAISFHRGVPQGIICLFISSLFSWSGICECCNKLSAVVHNTFSVLIMGNPHVPTPSRKGNPFALFFCILGSSLILIQNTSKSRIHHN